MEPHRPGVSAAGFWEGLYAGGQDGWELGGPAPALEDWLERGGRFEVARRAPGGLSADGGSAGAMSGPPQMKSLKNETVISPPQIAVPGCGRGHDARLLARHGYRVTAFDFADAAVAEARRLAAADGVAVAVEQRDVFTLARDYTGAFDGVWEYTCFCAIDPARREEYARVLHAILRPAGRLLACFYPLREGDGGPPFPVSREAIDRALAGRFTVLRAGPPGRSAEHRRGLEWLVEARRT
ncbi:MAG TPA: methyltransferase domain-containing protein [Methylomirabilota bacterium]|nr:methyltransferase domain-containing protein [Methylomirabilota bacterium]